MTDQPFQATPEDPHYYLRHLVPKAAVLAAWLVSYFNGGGKLPSTPEGWIAAACIVFLVLYDGGTSIRGARQTAPSKEA